MIRVRKLRQVREIVSDWVVCQLVAHQVGQKVNYKQWYKDRTA